MTLQKWAIFIWGSMGKFLIFCRILLKFCSWLYKKRRHTSQKFQLEITSNKKVIAEKPLTNLYEMNSSLYIVNSENSIGFFVCVFQRKVFFSVSIMSDTTWPPRVFLAQFSFWEKQVKSFCCFGVIVFIIAIWRNRHEYLLVLNAKLVSFQR